MTNEHQNRANGESFFSQEEMELIIETLESGDFLYFHMRSLLIEKLEKELEYIKSIKRERK